MLKKAQNTILEQLLALMKEQRLTHETLQNASVLTGHDPLYYRTIFNTCLDAARAIVEDLDEQMIRICVTIPLDTLPVRARIYEIIKQRLIIASVHKEAYRHLHYFMAQPCHILSGSQMNWKSVDRIWRLAGDASVDFNYYTKRALLLGVYTSTMLYWFQDQSPENMDTLTFLKRRIENALAIGSCKKRITGLFMPASVQG